MNWNVLLFLLAYAGGLITCYLLQRYREVLAWRQDQVETDRSIGIIEREIERLTELNKDLMDRLFQSKAMPPSGVDLTEVYEERKKNEREHKERTGGKPNPPGPLERLAEKWKDKDLKAREQGIDLTSDKHDAH